MQFECRSIFFHIECTSNVFSMIKTFGPVTRMGPNIWNALSMQSEFLEYTSNIQECTTNFHSDGIRAHSASIVTGVFVIRVSRWFNIRPHADRKHEHVYYLTLLDSGITLVQCSTTLICTCTGDHFIHWFD